MKRFAIWTAVLVLLTVLLIRWAYIERGGWGAGGEWLVPVLIAVLLSMDGEEETGK